MAQEIEEFREQEAREAAEKNSDGGTYSGSDMGTLEGGTMVAGGMGTVMDFGTMVNHGGASNSSGTMMGPGDVGTMVFNSGTMVGPGMSDSGTMVGPADSMAFGTLVINDVPSQQPALNVNSFARGDSADWNDQGTLVQPKAAPAGNELLYYKNDTKLHVHQSSSMDDLRTCQMMLNKAYEDELNALETFYQARRREVEELIMTKAKGKR